MLPAALTRILGDALLPAHAVRESVVMGTLLRIEVTGAGRDAALADAEAVLREIERLDRALTTWHPDSPMSVLNRSEVGRPVRPEAELFELLREAAAWSERTGGAFDPAVGALVDAWGLRRGGARPGGAALDRARAASGSRTFALDA